MNMDTQIITPIIVLVAWTMIKHPAVFYALVISMAVIGGGSGINMILA
jgi:hypothetical protein